MADYGRDLQFGASVEPLADPVDWAARIAKTADSAGLDLLGIQDHPYQRRFLDTWTLISTLVPQTENLRFFPDVASLPLRPPAMLAKAAASLDVLSDGRIEVGLGAGAFWDAIEAMDGPRRSPSEAVRSVEEAIQVMRMVWSDERSLKFDGEIYSLKGMRPGPKPPHEIGIWVGAYGPKMLNLIGRLADGWVPSLGYVQPGQLPEMHERIDKAAREAGREPREMQRVLNISGNIGGNGEGPLEGPASDWTRELSRLVLDTGFDTFIYWPREEHVNQIERFASEVVPGVREAVEKERS